MSKEAGTSRASSIPFLQLLKLTRQPRCTDPRDRAYALFGLGNTEGSAGSNEDDIQPDYTKPVGQVYRGIAVKFLMETGTLDISQCFSLIQ
jgi:hypothetical protein